MGAGQARQGHARYLKGPRLLSLKAGEVFLPRCSSQSFLRLANAVMDFGVCHATYNLNSHVSGSDGIFSDFCPMVFAEEYENKPYKVG